MADYSGSFEWIAELDPRDTRSAMYGDWSRYMHDMILGPGP